MSCIGRANGNLTELLGIWVRSNGTIGKHKDTLLAISLGCFVFENHDECARYARDAWGCLDDLESRTEHIASSVASASYLSVGLATLDDECAEVERVFYKLCSLLGSHALLFAQLEEEVGILLCVRVVLWLNDGSLIDILQAIFCYESIDFSLGTNEDDVCNTITQDAVCCLNCTRFSAFCKDDTLLIGLCLSNELIH